MNVLMHTFTNYFGYKYIFEKSKAIVERLLVFDPCDWQWETR